ncbi:MAG: 2-amino-4-hydroxy-6-hydroxymethyldihydropteridine diphosphokinase [Candidatus Dormibacteria bacterium]
MITTATAWVGLGANLGRRWEALARARAALLAEPPGVILEAVSREVLTRAVGLRRQPDYHNQVVRIRACRGLTALQWLQLCQAAEGRAGRRPTYRWGPRRVDIDILLLGERGELIIPEAAVTVPHPRLGERPFFCALLSELDPNLAHPAGWRFADRAGLFVHTTETAGRAGAAGLGRMAR